MAEQLSNNKFGWLIVRNGYSPRLTERGNTGPGALAWRRERSIVQYSAGVGAAGGNSRLDPVRRRRLGGDRPRGKLRSSDSRSWRHRQRPAAGAGPLRLHAGSPPLGPVQRAPQPSAPRRLERDAENRQSALSSRHTRYIGVESRRIAGAGADCCRPRHRRDAHRGAGCSGPEVRRPLCACRGGNSN